MHIPLAEHADPQEGKGLSVSAPLPARTYSSTRFNLQSFVLVCKITGSFWGPGGEGEGGHIFRAASARSVSSASANLVSGFGFRVLGLMFRVGSLEFEVWDLRFGV